jgi:hypothetical protein
MYHICILGPPSVCLHGLGPLGTSFLDMPLSAVPNTTAKALHTSAIFYPATYHPSHHALHCQK